MPHIDAQWATGLSASISHLTNLISDPDPAAADAARSEVLDLVLGLVPAARWATLSRSTQGGRGAATTATSGPVGALLDQLQWETTEGPTLTALTEGAVVHCDDLRGEARWPDLAARAVRDTEARSVCAYPLARVAGRRDTLTLYAGEPAAFTGETLTWLTLTAVSAGLAVAAISYREIAGEVERFTEH